MSSAALAQRAHDANRRGIALMLLAMACFIVNDTLVKFVSASLPAGQLIFVRGVFATLLVLAVLRASGARLRPRQLTGRWVVLRAAFDTAGTFTFLLSLFHLPLATATAIHMASPLMIALLAAWLLHERIGVRSALAIAAGFAGVLLVIQPNASGFGVWAWLCLLATLLVALRDIVTPRIGADTPSIAITLATAGAVTLTAALWSMVEGWAPMSARQVGLLAAAAVFLASGYHLIIRSTRLGALSVVAPFRYSALLLAVLLGWLVWGEVPNLLAWGGIALLVAAGLYLLRHSGR